MDRTQLEEVLLEPIYRPDTAAHAFTFQLYSWLQPVLFALTVLVLVSTFLGRPIRVDGDSMLPTLHDGDMLILQSIGYTPKSGDVVVLTPQAFRDGTPIVKRVVATGGQEVDIDYTTGTVYVDGAALEEDYLGEPMEPVNDQYWEQYPITVPEGHVFVLGDNRNHSSDSRVYGIGMVDSRRVLGRAVWILLPFQDFGGIAG